MPRPTQVQVAVIGLVSAVLVAVIGGVFALLKPDRKPEPGPGTTTSTTTTGAGSSGTTVTNTGSGTVVIGQPVPPVVPATDSREDKSFLVSAIPSAMNRGEFASADRMAVQLLALDPKNARALNARGSVAFYEQRYKEAAQFFTQVHNLDPANVAYTYNLADTYVELGMYTQAEQLYGTLPDDGDDLYYAKGRLSLLQGKYKDAVELLRVVATGHNRGTARILEAAALGALNDPEAAKEFAVGYAQDPEYWQAVLPGVRREPRESYTEVARLLEKHDVWKH